jgi:hypothetical protein
MNAGNTHISGRFWAMWTLASAIGLIVGGMVSLPIAYGLGEIVADAVNESLGFAVAGALFGIFVGGGLGAGQQLVLRSRTDWSRNWALASAAATALVWAIAFPLFISVGEPASTPSGAAIAVLFGLALGVAQWLVMRNQLPGSGRWIVISTVSLALAIGLALSLDGEGRELLAFGAAGLLAGALTGLGMAWLLGASARVVSSQLSDA